MHIEDACVEVKGSTGTSDDVEHLTPNSTWLLTLSMTKKALKVLQGGYHCWRRKTERERRKVS